ncbi:unnamed protein product [Lactuca virosa]|uniref:Uncharacterized protein n=1 Tax=Lactuca virosa TaxID=75947 RepID=A0AAU9NZP6_9ASTR|nr:unnamed protein product [Lactuca virosa]
MIGRNPSCSLTPPPHRPQPFVVAFLDSDFSSHHCSSHESLASTGTGFHLESSKVEANCVCFNNQIGGTQYTLIESR